ncbi:hypothetical protein [Chengkuizengella sediminis]|uniref:hypothetical protein n=1 Tax=Chengkuizengella sediminis TaxID=1885917 RepID=UPI00138A259E|nr:hypothetical protein [Chengkuizengella sediminis]NDI33179.1 hypothetical protein [Chengkuizengella sediminis]
MSFFDESICDCCTCPMQCILEQLVGVDNVTILTQTFFGEVIINRVEDFVVFTNQGIFPVCQITGVAFSDPTVKVNLKLLSNNNKGVCACCENPITNLAMLLIGKIVDVELIGFSLGFIEIEIIDVGKGIVVGRNPLVPNDINIFSSCAIIRIIPVRIQQMNNQPTRFSNFRTLKKNKSSLTT